MTAYQLLTTHTQCDVPLLLNFSELQRQGQRLPTLISSVRKGLVTIVESKTRRPFTELSIVRLAAIDHPHEDDIRARGSARWDVPNSSSFTIRLRNSFGCDALGAPRTWSRPLRTIVFFIAARRQRILMSPTGVSHENTGIGDAVDLGWKLEAATRAGASRPLLDCMMTERSPADRPSETVAEGEPQNLRRMLVDPRILPAGVFLRKAGGQPAV